MIALAVIEVPSEGLGIASVQMGCKEVKMATLARCKELVKPAII